MKPPGEGGEEEEKEGKEEERRSWGEHFHIYMPIFKDCKVVSSICRGF